MYHFAKNLATLIDHTSKAPCGCKLERITKAYGLSTQLSPISKVPSLPASNTHSNLFGRPTAPLRSMMPALSHTTIGTIVPTFGVDKTGKAHGQPRMASHWKRAPRHQRPLDSTHQSAVGSLLSLS
jgi:hypothetical protein